MESTFYVCLKLHSPIAVYKILLAHQMIRIACLIQELMTTLVHLEFVFSFLTLQIVP
jgi:hypothetical protein